MSAIQAGPGSKDVLQPLTRQETDLLTRLLSDPTLLPREFKRWVTDHASDTVDIAKSQVHGLVDSDGLLVIPVPEVVSEIRYIEFIGLVTLTGGSGGPIFTSPAIEVDGNAVVMEFFAPFCEFNNLRLAVSLDGNNAGWIGEFKINYNQGTQAAPDQSQVARAPLYIQRAFVPPKGTHTFGLYGQTYGSRLHYVGGGGTFYGEGYAPGFFRLSRA